MLAGTSIRFSAFWIAFTAAPRETPGAVSKETFAAGNWETWFTCRGAGMLSTVAKVASGTEVPDEVGSEIWASEPGFCRLFGAASRISRYWFDWVMMVELMRWP